MLQENRTGDAQQQQQRQVPVPLLRSVSSGTAVQLVFCNRSPRKVRLLWINFRGRPQSYGVLQPRTGKRVHTFVGHPWMFRDDESDDPMMVNNKEVYLPNAVENNKVSMVNITLPVFSLRERCLQVVRKLVSSKDFPRLEIARCLQEDLAQRPSTLVDLQRIQEQMEHKNNCHLQD